MATVVGRTERTRTVRAVRSSEDVLCVARTTIFPDGAWHGLVHGSLERVLRTVRASSEYRARSAVEDDPDQQQIIPYCVVSDRASGTYLLTRRLRRSTEQRLHDRHSLGLGGHINPEDGRDGDPVVGGLIREWAEEVRCEAPAEARLVAMLNDDSTSVSRVHLGLVFVVTPASGRVTIRETEKLEGEYLTLDAMRRHYLSMESWSQLVFDDLTGDATVRAEASPLVVQLPPSP